MPDVIQGLVLRVKEQILLPIKSFLKNMSYKFCERF